MSEKVGDIIKKARLSKGYTLSELSKKTGLPISTINSYEAGYTKDIKKEKLFLICDALDLKIPVAVSAPEPPAPTMTEEIGARIKALRLKQHLPLRAVAAKLQITPSTLRRWEEGLTISGVKTRELEALAKALNTTPQYLVFGDTPLKEFSSTFGNTRLIMTQVPTDPKTVEPSPQGQEEKELLRIFRDLPLKGRVALLSRAIELEDEYAEK